ncbi:hypothetical protein SAMN06269185_2577 [Natronoarchaeum philippinense]|uniref:Uncharacterized protein n=1 Tax=Natronoarchaeum philippinense TaxID=558529 RepID=A0A285P1W2_NATPI|nr:hypothetical protein [Natronoarchaeum philippinense]SNZ15722.1 hypothetical protein SAMN06269185_2577 [Natronoarchaeum philippinense]
MLKRLGATGIVGLLAILGGIALIASESLVVAGGIALVLAGIGLIVRALVTSLINSMGMGGMF